eukprot:evm.model.scf_3279.1 EVM.evm.TU.scf_3279.1   scf_3279:4616-5322(-)
MVWGFGRKRKGDERPKASQPPGEEAVDSGGDAVETQGGEPAEDKQVEVRITYHARAKAVTLALRAEDGDCSRVEQLTETQPGSCRFTATIRRPAGKLAFFFIVD